ncbi:hypothetical protein ABIF63_000240 [Bradyrhizobium japonicum]|uniref:Uncharacterized protein n=1 Tax=Bradyrhizobium japonicum TaxID=375 RepID=A0ABV2RH55_BRAJP
MHQLKVVSMQFVPLLSSVTDLAFEHGRLDLIGENRKMAGQLLEQVPLGSVARSLMSLHSAASLMDLGEEDSQKVVGLSTAEFAKADPVDFTKQIKSTFDPTPTVATKVFKIGQLNLGVMHVECHPSRPVIATKSDGSIKEGDIFYRYPGQSARIKYSDLRTLLDERDKQARLQILPMVDELLKLGPRKAMITDLERGVMTGDGVSLQIEAGLVDQIQFIREGEFSEKKGAPTLRLMGDVQAVRAGGEIVRRGFVTPSDIVRDFLEQSSPYEPKEYVRCVLEGGNGAWLPIHYFARKAGLDASKLAVFIDGTNAPNSRKDIYKDRASGKKTAFKASSGQGTLYLSRIMLGESPELPDATAASHVGFAICALSDQPPMELRQLLGLLLRSKELIEGSAKAASAMSVMRRAAARVDELYFSGPGK